MNMLPLLSAGALFVVALTLLSVSLSPTVDRLTDGRLIRMFLLGIATALILSGAGIVVTNLARTDPAAPVCPPTTPTRTVPPSLG